MSIVELGSPYLILYGAILASLRRVNGTEYKMYLREQEAENNISRREFLKKAEFINIKELVKGDTTTPASESGNGSSTENGGGSGNQGGNTRGGGDDNGGSQSGDDD